jgi:hypothetical protein
MRGIAKTQAADPDRFEAVERRVADVKRCRRSDDGLLVVPDSPGVRLAR